MEPTGCCVSPLCRLRYALLPKEGQMASKRVFPVVALFLMVALCLVLSPGTAWAGPPDESPEVQKPEIKLEVTTSPSNEDADWPIVSIESYTYPDPITGETHFHTTIVRESPPTYRPPAERLLACAGGRSTAAANEGPTTQACTYRISDTRSDADSVGGVTSRVKHYADKYCSDANCLTVYRKPTQLDVWWTRLNTSYSVQNAVVHWGCGLCTICGGGTFQYVYQDGPFTPAWQSSTTSYTYRYTGTWPILRGSTACVDGASDSDAYLNGVYQGHLSAHAEWCGD